MKYLVAAGFGISDFLNYVYSSLTIFFQGIQLDKYLSFFCEYNLLVSVFVFLLFATYFVFFDKMKTYHNLTLPKNLSILLCLLFLYYFLSNKSVNLSALGLGTITINPFLLMVVAKLYGAIPTAVFGAAEYFIMCIKNSNDPLMFSLFFIYAVGGMIHGWILYEHKTSFWRCLLARVITAILCNIILIPFVRAGTYTHAEALSVFIPQTITSNILQVPIQSFVGYIALRLIKLLRKKFDF